MTRVPLVVLAALLIGGATGTRPAAQAGPARADQPYATAATAILVDVVVRDRRGLPVTDLSADDFAIAEDGVAQKIDTFSRISRGGGIGLGVGWKSPSTTIAVAGPSSSQVPTATPGPESEATVALVFDHLSSASLRLAQRATLDYLPMSGESAVRVGVFASDPGIRVVQPYTTDRTLVRSAVGRVLPSGSSIEEMTGERAEALTDRRRDLRGQGAPEAAGGTTAALARTAAEAGQRENELRLIQTELNMIRSFDYMDRDHRGYDTSLALMRVITSLSHYPGRKTVVFFSEGLPASPALAGKLDAVIDAANRANVTAYAVDAKGLRTHSDLAGVRKEIDGFAEERRFQNDTGAERTEQPMTMAFERVEDTLRLDSRTGLARLSEDTGGFLVEQSNDLSGAFRRIDEDNRFHYLLTYSPNNMDFNGRFRTIGVKVRRPGTQVFARRGYRAVRAPLRGAPGGHQAAALALLDRSRLPNAFPIHAAGFSFPDPARPGLTPVVVQVDTGALRYDIDQQRSTYAARAAVVVRIRDGQGRELEKLTQEYLISGDARDVEAAKRGEILFYREPQLPAGVYTLESIVYDGNAQQGSARVATLTVPAPQSTAMSSLVLVNRVEEVGDTPAVSAPLYVGRTLMYPNLGQPIRRASTAELPFFFTIWGSTVDATAHVQLLRHGQLVAEAPIELATPTGSRLQQVGRLPIAALSSGTYELRIKVDTRTQGVLARNAFFTIE
jgi:VWFA-related protein